MNAFKAFAVTVALTTATATHAQTTIEASSATPTFIGTFGPGTYNFTTTGTVSLQGPVGSGFDLNANGVPLPGSVSDPTYSEFNPNGTDRLSSGEYGPAGAGINFGALAGTFDATGSGPFFLLGSNATLTFASTTSVFGLVNDTFPSNNAGSFVTAVSAVPEASTWGMMLLGFGAVGYSVRRRRVRHSALQAA